MEKSLNLAVILVITLTLGLTIVYASNCEESEIITFDKCPVSNNETIEVQVNLSSLLSNIGLTPKDVSEVSLEYYHDAGYIELENYYDFMSPYGQGQRPYYLSNFTYDSELDLWTTELNIPYHARDDECSFRNIIVNTIKGEYILEGDAEFEVESSSPDNIDPVFYDLYVDDTEYDATEDDILKIYINMSDDLSGIYDAKVKFETDWSWQGGEYEFYVSNFEYDSELDLWVAEYTLDDSLISGRYTLTEIFILDNIYNELRESYSIEVPVGDGWTIEKELSEFASFIIRSDISDDWKCKELFVGDSITVEGKTITLNNVGSATSNTPVIVDVDGVVETITGIETVNGLRIEVGETNYHDSMDERSAYLCVYGDGYFDEEECDSGEPDEITIHSISLSGSGIADNTFENGWKFSFYLSVPEDEFDLNLYVKDWQSNDNIIETNSNTIIQYDGVDYAIGSATDYSESESFTIVDEDEECPKIQVSFDLLIKIPEIAEAGSYSTSYGIKSVE